MNVTSSPFNLTWRFSFSGVVPTVMVIKDTDIQMNVFKNAHGTSGTVILTINGKALGSVTVDKISIAIILIQNSGRPVTIKRSVVTLYISTGNLSALKLLQLFRNKQCIQNASVKGSVLNFHACTKC